MYKLRIQEKDLNTYAIKELLLLIAKKIPLEFEKAEIKDSIKKHFEEVK